MSGYKQFTAIQIDKETDKHTPSMALEYLLLLTDGPESYRDSDHNFSELKKSEALLKGVSSFETTSTSWHVFTYTANGVLSVKN